MKNKSAVLILLLLLAPLVARGDIAFPTVTKVYFEKDGQPYHFPVDFTVTCYGYSVRPGPDLALPRKKEGTYTPVNVFSFSAQCPDYGCEIHENYYLNYRIIDYCSLVGKSEGKDFKIEKYSKEPVDFSACIQSKDKKFERSCQMKFTIPKE